MTRKRDSESGGRVERESPRGGPKMSRRGVKREKKTAQLVERGETPSTPGGVRRRSDDALAREIREILTADPELEGSEIEVDVQGGAVTLTGVVQSEDAKLLAEELVESVPGTRQVHNELRIER